MGDTISSKGRRPQMAPSGRSPRHGLHGPIMQGKSRSMLELQRQTSTAREQFGIDSMCSNFSSILEKVVCA
jgi:hypothetical protein